MRLIPNWKNVALRSHSMWAVYLGIAALVAPEVALLFTGRETINPYFTGYAGLALLIYGGLGRLWDQGIGDK